MRGTGVTVMARAASAEGGCAARISAHAPGSSRKWIRLLRWSELAWAGTTQEGATLVSFFEDEGRMPADRVAFAPPDGAGFRTMLGGHAARCRLARGEYERMTLTGPVAPRGCYFARLPGLHVVGADPARPDPPRAVLSVLARETPEAEMRFLFEHAPRRNTKGDGWGSMAAIFTFADPKLTELRIADANFALDGVPVATPHSLVAYGDTRLRIEMDRPGMTGVGRGQASFYRRLATSGETRLTLIDAAGKSRAVLHFDSGPALAAAREALAAADWSCVGATPSPPPAARWEADE